MASSTSLSSQRNLATWTPGPRHWWASTSHRDVIITALMQAPVFRRGMKLWVHPSRCCCWCLTSQLCSRCWDPDLSPLHTYNTMCPCPPHELYLQSWRGESFLLPKIVLLLLLNLLGRTIFNINMNTLQGITCKSPFAGSRTRLPLSCLSDFFSINAFPCCITPKNCTCQNTSKVNLNHNLVFPDDPYLQARSIGQCGLRRLNWSKQHVEIYLVNYHANHRTQKEEKRFLGWVVI